MRKFKETIFFGNEDCLGQCYSLHKRLEEGFDIVSGLQQPDHPDSLEHANQLEEERIDLNKELVDIGLDILDALGLSNAIFNRFLEKAENNYNIWLKSKI